MFSEGVDMVGSCCCLACNVHHSGGGGNGEINGKDILIIRKYLANYNYDTGKSTVVLGPTA